MSTNMSASSAENMEQETKAEIPYATMVTPKPGVEKTEDVVFYRKRDEIALPMSVKGVISTTLKRKFAIPSQTTEAISLALFVSLPVGWYLEVSALGCNHTAKDPSAKILTTEVHGTGLQEIFVTFENSAYCAVDVIPSRHPVRLRICKKFDGEVVFSQGIVESEACECGHSSLLANEKL